MKKTNAVRILESRGVQFRAIQYEYNKEELDAVSVAEKIGAVVEQVFKTLVCRDNNNDHFTFIIPANYELDLKKAAEVTDSKKIDMIKSKELFPLTGYVRGGCSPIGMKKEFRTFIDDSAQLFENIYVSAGIRGMQIFISPIDLSEAVSADFADLLKI